MREKKKEKGNEKGEEKEEREEKKEREKSWLRGSCLIVLSLLFHAGLVAFLKFALVDNRDVSYRTEVERILW